MRKDTLHQVILVMLVVMCAAGMVTMATVYNKPGVIKEPTIPPTSTAALVTTTSTTTASTTTSTVQSTTTVADLTYVLAKTFSNF